MKREGRCAVFAWNSRRAVAIHNLLAAGAIAQHRVGVAGAATHLVLAELNHADFRVQGLHVVDGLRKLLFVSQDEHLFLAFRL